MARRPSTTPAPRPANLSPEQMRSGITKLERRVAELQQLDVSKITAGDDPAVKKLSAAIQNTLASIFGPDSHEYGQLINATQLDDTQYVMRIDPFGGGGGTPVPEIQEGVARGRDSAVAMLQQAADSIKEELEDLPEPSPSASGNAATQQRPAGSVSISPTIYSYGANAQIQVGQTNAITIDRRTVQFQEFERQMTILMNQLQGSNDMPAEAKEQLTGELRAGMEIIKTPKPNRGALQSFLVQPLIWMAKEFTSGTIRAAAAAALATLATIAGTLF
jgi:hypothetical protein